MLTVTVPSLALVSSLGDILGGGGLFNENTGCVGERKKEEKEEGEEIFAGPLVF